MHDVDVVSHCRLWILVDHGDHEEFGLYVCETRVGGGGGGCGVSGEFFFLLFSFFFLFFGNVVGMANRWYLMLTWFRTCFLGGVFKIVHAGKRLCLLTGIMKREKDGAIVATCEHNKYNIDADESKM